MEPTLYCHMWKNVTVLLLQHMFLWIRRTELDCFQNNWNKVTASHCFFRMGEHISMWLFTCAHPNTETRTSESLDVLLVVPSTFDIKTMPSSSKTFKQLLPRLSWWEGEREAENDTWRKMPLHKCHNFHSYVRHCDPGLQLWHFHNDVMAPMSSFWDHCKNYACSPNLFFHPTPFPSFKEANPSGGGGPEEY